MKILSKAHIARQITNNRKSNKIGHKRTNSKPIKSISEIYCITAPNQNNHSPRNEQPSYIRLQPFNKWNRNRGRWIGNKKPQEYHDTCHHALQGKFQTCTHPFLLPNFRPIITRANQSKACKNKHHKPNHRAGQIAPQQNIHSNHQ